MMEISEQMTQKLIEWYAEKRRILPWRENPTPYHVWISEIMLQQTRVDTVKGYYARFLASCPDIRALAEAPEDVYMKLWEGLGYYSRVRNMHKAAEEIMTAYGGEMPGSYEKLLGITGIGPYTAAAIASIAFGEKVPAVDGNLLRVFARLSAYPENIKTEKARKVAAEYYLRWMPEGVRTTQGTASAEKCLETARLSLTDTGAGVPDADRVAERATCAAHGFYTPGSFNQALGATICLPNRAPLCTDCPLRDFCTAHARGEETAYPVMPEKKARRIEDRTVFLIHDAGRIVIGKRPPKGLLASLYEFPNTEGHLSEADALRYVAGLGIQALRIRPLPAAKHIFSHIEWRMSGYSVCVGSAEAPAGCVWASREQLQNEYTLPGAFKAYKKKLGL